MFPGYVLLNMEMNDDTWYVFLRNLPFRPPILERLIIWFLCAMYVSAESTILLGFHSIRMSLLILGSIVVTLLALGTC